MADSPTGMVAWMDLTVKDAPVIRDFYRDVAGWTSSDVPMHGYDDYNMHAPDGSVVAGIAHADGPNTDLPVAWLVYITVPDLDASMASAEARGGKVVGAIRDLGEGSKFCVIQDPAGAYCALLQSATVRD
jgi:predicted enzyme related to lactoylglutathione lyase